MISIQKDFYKLLEIERNANHEEIKSSYRKLALQFHPDKNRNTKKSEQIFIFIQKAYETLSNIELRTEYDSCLKKNSII